MTQQKVGWWKSLPRAWKVFIGIVVGFHALIVLAWAVYLLLALGGVGAWLQDGPRAVVAATEGIFRAAWAVVYLSAYLLAPIVLADILAVIILARRFLYKK